MKLMMVFFIVIYIAFVHRFIGLDFFTKKVSNVFRVLFSEMMTFGISAYLYQKLNNLDRLRIKEIDHVIIDLRASQQKDKQLKLVLESLEEGILML